MEGICLSLSSERPLRDLPPHSLSAVVLGHPFCPARQARFIEDPDVLRRAVAAVHGLGAQAFLATPPVVLDFELDRCVDALAAAARCGADGFEVCDLGLAAALRQACPDRSLLAGPLMNVYGQETARLLQAEGFAALCPSIELDSGALASLCAAAVPLMTTVYGRVPLSFGRSCLERWLQRPSAARGTWPGEDEPSIACRGTCAAQGRLIAWKEGRALAFGRAMLSSRPYDLYDELPRLWSFGARLWRIEGLAGERGLGAAVACFRSAWQALRNGAPLPRRRGLPRGSNGFFYAEAGSRRCNAAQTALPRSELRATPPARKEEPRAGSSPRRSLPCLHPGLPALLAPAGNPEAVAAAFANGADGVYVGLKGWSLRSGLNEFNEDALRRAAERADRAGGWLAACVNIAALPGEEDAALDAVAASVRCGAHAVVIGDLGLLQAARREFPALPLHASIQLSAANRFAVERLALLGADVVVVSRYLDTPAALRPLAGGVPLEIFVHGDLCTFHDSKCYLTAHLNRRRVAPGQAHGSATVTGCSNRGECIKPCRSPFHVRESPFHSSFRRQGLFRLGWVPELVRLGVSILKIEGRQFGADYVAAATRCYREALDRAASGLAPATPARSRALRGKLEALTHLTVQPSLGPAARLPVLGEAKPKIVVGLHGTADPRYMQELIAAGADEFFLGYEPSAWAKEFGYEFSPNRRYRRESQITDRRTLDALCAAARAQGRPVSVAFNEHLVTESAWRRGRRLLQEAATAGVGAVIVADPAVIGLAASEFPELAIHVSGDAGTCNAASGRLFFSLGAKRLIFPRDLGWADLSATMAELRAPDRQFEVFAMGEPCHFDGARCFTEHGYGFQKDFCHGHSAKVLHRPGRGKPEYLAPPEEKILSRYREQKPWKIGRCGLCAVKDLAGIGITHLKVPGRSSLALRSVGLLRRVLDERRPPGASLAREFMGMPELCASRWLCYYPDKAVLDRRKDKLYPNKEL
jgi:collagenase-like PrtC family protease